MPNKHRKNEDNSLFPQNQDSDNPGQKSLGQYCNIHIFLSFSRFPLKTVHHFRKFLPVLPPPTPPYTKLKLGKNSGYTRPTLFVGGGEGLELYELENAPETRKCPKNFVHDFSYKVWHSKLVSLWCGRTDGRTVTWLPKFLGWIDYKHFLDMGPCCARSALVEFC